MPQKYGMNGANRPFGPDAKPCVHNCSATLGASRLATAQALGGFMIIAPRPAISHLLLEASSHAGASGRNNLASLLYYSSGWRTGSLFTVTLPLASTSIAPNEWKIAPAVSTESAVTPSPMPKPLPAFWHASAAFISASSVHASACGAAPAG